VSLRGDETRSETVQHLISLGPAALEVLCRALCEANPLLREAAAAALGQIGDGRAAQSLTRALGDANSYVRDAAARAVVRLGTPALGPLGRALGDVQRGEAAARALGEIGELGAVESLCLILEVPDAHAAFVFVRSEAAEALYRLTRKGGCPEMRRALPVLDRLARTNGEYSTYYRAARAIREVTLNLRELPLPASSPSNAGGTLPRPSEAHPASAE
jgi:HEAT repeat protein